MFPGAAPRHVSASAFQAREPASNMAAAPRANCRAHLQGRIGGANIGKEDGIAAARFSGAPPK
jgi:hypothetical protein